MHEQGHFNFEAGAGERDYHQWLAGRRLAVEELARRLGLPLGHHVEVWLCGGIRLRGELRMRQEMLLLDEEQVRHLELSVDRVPFTYRELESCVRLD